MVAGPTKAAPALLAQAGEPPGLQRLLIARNGLTDRGGDHLVAVRERQRARTPFLSK